MITYRSEAIRTLVTDAGPYVVEVKSNGAIFWKPCVRSILGAPEVPAEFDTKGAAKDFMDWMVREYGGPATRYRITRALSVIEIIEES